MVRPQAAAALLAPLAVLGLAAPAAADPQTFFMFGDSYSDTGFVLGSGSPSAANPFGNPALPVPFSNNGPNWLKQLAVEYNSSEYIVWDLAKASATVDNDLVEVRSSVPSFTEQIEDLFLPNFGDRTASAYANWTDDAIFGVWFGINDATMSFTKADTAELYLEISDRYWSLVETLYVLGARRFFFNLVPALWLGPTGYSEEVRVREHDAIVRFNELVVERLVLFREAHPDVQTVYVDMSVLFEEMLRDYRTLGFATNDTYCEAYKAGTAAVDTWNSSCPYPVDKYFWLNDVHVTSTAHRYIAQAVALALEAIGLPTTFSAENATVGAGAIVAGDAPAGTSSAPLAAATGTATATARTAGAAASAAAALAKPFAKTFLVQS
ncbi:uncharacterized protein V1510DRAFT_436864 [Dipodascopsis tothii]|uniref:uncharacterized protein n=1 Tax=Dipodascopsis tothii TaxID=44089 RepID=UPI0034CF6173